MSRRVIKATRRRFVIIYVIILLIGAAFFYLAKSNTQPSSQSKAYSQSTAQTLWIQYLFFLGSQTLYVVPVALSKRKLRMTNRTATVLSAFPLVYIVGYALFLSYAVNQAGRVDLSSNRGVLLGLLPLGAGIVPLVGVLTVASSALRKLSRRRAEPSTGTIAAQWGEGGRGQEIRRLEGRP